MDPVYQQTMNPQSVLQRLGVWRMRLNCLTGFIVFMSGCLLIALLFFPLLWIAPISAQRKADLRFALIQRCFQFFVQMLTLLRGLRPMVCEGLIPRPDSPPRVYIANHPSLLDVVMLLSVIPHCTCIVKAELFKHPFFGGVLRQADLIPNHGGAELLTRIDQELARGRSLLIFPEGSRSPLDGLHPFNRGAARILLHTQIPFVPVLVRCDPTVLRKGQAWYDMPSAAVGFHLRFFPEQASEGLVDPLLPMPRQVRALNSYLYDFFLKVL